MAMPRTEKRVVSSHGREQNYNPFFNPIGESLLINERKNGEERKPLVKKCRVFSGNNYGFNNGPNFHGNNG
jgi:hypothetical protein